MQIASYVITYVVLWWLIFFILLPIKVKIDQNPPTGQAVGAPSVSYVGYKAVATSVIALVATYVTMKYGVPAMVAHYANKY